MAQQKPDIHINDQGSIVVFTPLTKAGEDWIQQNVEFESWQMLGRGLCVDHRPAQGLVELIQEAGLTLG